jgi:hypothetical protein
MKEIGVADRREVGRRLNNRAENSHQPFRRRERAMQLFRSARALQKFSSIQAQVHNHSHGQSRVNSEVLHEEDSNSCLAIRGLSPIAQPGRYHTRSNSHSVAVRDGCTNIPLAAGGARGAGARSRDREFRRVGINLSRAAHSLAERQRRGDGRKRGFGDGDLDHSRSRPPERDDERRHFIKTPFSVPSIEARLHRSPTG